MRTVFFGLGEGYEVKIGRGALKLLGGTVRALTKGEKAAFVFDTGLPEEAAACAVDSLGAAGMEVFALPLASGEGAKNLCTVEKIYGFLYDCGITRADCVISMGGGVVGDIVGFAAATYLRGVGLVSVPTTVISQTDSAYGGKTGVDFKEGKNHIGCFYHPRAVVTDPDLLLSLPERERAAGMGEIIKYGAIADPSILGSVSHGLPGEELIARCVEIKRSFVEGDELDFGKRRILNFGHTFGHAIEESTDYSISHGQAVAYGMLAAARLGERLSATSPEVYPAILGAVLSAGLDADWERFIPAALPLIGRDKKKEGGKIAFVIIKSLGEPTLARLGPDEISSILL